MRRGWTGPTSYRKASSQPVGRPGPVLPFAAMSATSEAPAAFRHSAARPGPLALIREGIDEILSRRRLVRYLVQADLKKKGADTLLGNIWWVLDPLLQMVVYVVFVAVILQSATPDYPLFILSAILPWKWFTASVSDATGSVVSQERLIKQIQFPKIVLPVAATTAGVVGFGFGLIALAVIMLFYVDRVSLNLLLIPAIAVVQYVFTLAFALAVASVNVFFRDLGNVMRHVLRLWFYLSPALYSISEIHSGLSSLRIPSSSQVRSIMVAKAVQRVRKVSREMPSATASCFSRIGFSLATILSTSSQVFGKTS